MDRPLSLRLEPSRIAQGWCLAVGSLAAVAIAISGIPLPARLALWLLVVWQCCQSILAERHLRWRTVLFEDGQWQLETATGEAVPVDLGNGLYSGFGLVVLPVLLPSGHRDKVLVWPDSTSAESRRQLRLASNLPIRY